MIRKDGSTAAAWLSSVRVVRRPLKCGNERNPYCMLNIHTGLPFFFRREEGGDDVKSSWRLHPGLHTWRNGWDNGLPSRKAELILINPSSVRTVGCNSPTRRGVGSNRKSALLR